MSEAWIACGASLVVGAIGGVLGVGGGVFLVPFLVVGLGLSPHAAIGVSAVVVVATSLGGSVRALDRGTAHIGLALWVEPFLVVGALAAAWFAQRVSGNALLVVFMTVATVVGLVFVVRPEAKRRPVPPLDERSPFDAIHIKRDGTILRYRAQHVVALAPLAALSGTLAGLLGIGGGAVTVPILATLARVPARAAAATSTVSMAAAGAMSALVHVSHGSVPLTLAAASALGAVPGSFLGARAQARFSERALRRTFGVFALVVALVLGWRLVGGSR